MRSYPYIGKDNMDNATALITSKSSGVCLLSDASTSYSAGEYGTDWDEGFLEDITADYLSNTYGEVESRDHADFIVKLARKFSFDGVFQATYPSWFCFDHDELFFMGTEKDANDCGEKKINLPLPPKEDKEVSKKLPGIAIIPDLALDWPCVKVSVEKPIYTKEMHERGELPPVGSEVLVPHTGSERHKVVVGTPDKDNMIIAMCNGYYRRLNADDVRPLPPPVDELAKELRHVMNTNLNMEKLSKAIINGDIDLSKYVGGGNEQ